jgi:hypothetical protein|tara:strand:+ start:2825 stop:3175 length:351 start_codon:yes stop_codon:yes gene_type:complete
MTYSNNPHTVYNGYMSGQRNMFLSSSVAIVMIGFSNSFKRDTVKLSIKICGLLIIMLSIFIGLTSTHDFKYYLSHNKEPLPSYIPLTSWKSLEYVTYIYSGILICLAVLFISRKIL